MSDAVDSAPSLLKRLLRGLPREHGFWVMSSAIVLSAFVRHPGLATAGVGLLAMAGMAFAGSAMRRRVRRDGRWQLASSALLAAASVPIDLVGGARLAEALAIAGAWVTVFSTFMLSVWASTARSSKVRRPRVQALTLLAFLLPLAAAAVFAFAEWRAPALASLLASVASVAFAIWRPGAKQMKAVGLSLTGAMTFTALLLAML